MKKIGPKITLSNAGCPDDMPSTFTAQINTSRYGLALNAIASVRYRDPEAPHHATPYRVCRVTDLKPLPNYMDGKRTRVTFELVKNESGESRKMIPPDKYEIFVGQELSVQAIWKTVHPACPGESDLAMFLTNRAYSRGISISQLRGKGRNALVKLIMLDEEGGAA